MARRGEHSLTEIKDMVIKAAETIVIKDGYQGLTIRKIAMETGYTVGSVYMVFTNMTDVIMHLKLRTLENLLISLGKTGDDDLEATAKAYLYFARSNFNLWSMIYEHRLPETTSIPEWYQEITGAIYNRMAVVIRKTTLKKNREQIKLAARVLVDGIHGVCMGQLNDNMSSIEEIEQAVLLLVRNFVRGWTSS